MKTEVEAEITQLAAEVAAAIAADGYVYLNDAMPEEHHVALLTELGTIDSRSEVKVNARLAAEREDTRVRKGRPGPYDASAFGFHTDNIRVDVMSMYCIEQDAVDGAILLLDTSDVDEVFSADEIAVLQGLELLAPPLTGGAKQEDLLHLAPLLSTVEGRHRLYYIPWLLHDWYGTEETIVLAKLADYVRCKQETETIRLPVRPGEAVVIDNHRMLHGRAAIADDSQRHMVRFYVSVPYMSCVSTIRKADVMPIEVRQS